MRVDAKERICGVRPADLTKLLRTAERFDTPTAMKYLESEEPRENTEL